MTSMWCLRIIIYHILCTWTPCREKQGKWLRAARVIGTHRLQWGKLGKQPLSVSIGNLSCKQVPFTFRVLGIWMTELQSVSFPRGCLKFTYTPSSCQCESLSLLEKKLTNSQFAFHVLTTSGIFEKITLPLVETSVRALFYLNGCFSCKAPKKPPFSP